MSQELFVCLPITTLLTSSGGVDFAVLVQSKRVDLWRSPIGRELLGRASIVKVVVFFFQWKIVCGNLMILGEVFSRIIIISKQDVSAMLQPLG